MKYVILLLSILIYTPIIANDGAYYASGNQLIPISETDICITKEVLSITKTDDQYLYVTVEYFFFNPKGEKTILVGFEAPSPGGDVNGYPVEGRHPYISDFSVALNGDYLNHATAIVNQENYYVNNRIQSKTEDEVIDEGFDVNNPNFYYVYHFNATFQKGVNSIVHTYKFNLSGSVSEAYSFDYILTAANRWANNQIDDFTLHIDMGSSADFYIKQSFFNDQDYWNLNGCKLKANPREYSPDEALSRFIVKDGPITFKKQNFKPEGELSVHALTNYNFLEYEVFDYEQHDLPTQIKPTLAITKSKNENSFKILRNLPYARRGYIFKNALIRTYYSKQKWYIPDPNYTATTTHLTFEEQNWIEKVKQETWGNN